MTLLCSCWEVTDRLLETPNIYHNVSHFPVASGSEEVCRCKWLCVLEEQRKNCPKALILQPNVMGSYTHDKFSLSLYKYNSALLMKYQSHRKTVVSIA